MQRITVKLLDARRVLFRRLKDPERRKVAALLLPGAVLVFRYLTVDVADATTVPALVIDRALQLGAVCALIGLGFVLLGPGGPAALGGVVTVGVVVATSASVLVAAIRPPRDHGVLVGAALCCVAAFVAGRTLLELCPSPFGLGRPRLTLAIVTGLLFPALQFWQATSFSSYVSRASAVVDPSARVVGTTPSSFVASVATTIENKQDTRLQVIISDLKICWWARGEEVVYDTDELDGRANCMDADPVDRLSWLDARAPLMVSRTLEVPRASPRLVVIARLYYARGDRVRISPREVLHPDLSGCSNEEVYTLEEESRYKALAQTDKLLIFADGDGDGGTNVYVQRAGLTSCSGGLRSRLHDYFGMGVTRVVREVWLTAPDDDTNATGSDASGAAGSPQLPRQTGGSAHPRP